MLRLEAINQYYGQSHILWDVELEVPKGACACLMGRNGVGKSTLLKCLLGLLPVRSGSIHFLDRKLDRLSVEQRVRSGIGYVPQGREIFPLLTVEENLRVALNGRIDGRRAIPPMVHELFPVLRDMRRRRGGDLSGGQQQQLAIARALVLDPKLLILDEPTEGIQPTIVREIGEALRRLNHEMGLTILLVEQKLPFARQVADRFHILSKGRKVCEGMMPALTDDVVRRHLSV